MAAVTIYSLQPKKIKSFTVSIVSPSMWHEVMILDAVILVFWMLNFKPAFYSSLSLSLRGSLVPLHSLPLGGCHLCVLTLLLFVCDVPFFPFLIPRFMLLSLYLYRNSTFLISVVFVLFCSVARDKEKMTYMLFWWRKTFQKSSDILEKSMY